MTMIDTAFIDREEEVLLLVHGRTYETQCTKIYTAQVPMVLLYDVVKEYVPLMPTDQV